MSTSRALCLHLRTVNIFSHLFVLLRVSQRTIAPHFAPLTRKPAVPITKYVVFNNGSRRSARGRRTCERARVSMRTCEYVRVTLTILTCNASGARTVWIHYVA